VDIVILSIISTSENGLTANLKAPIVSNTSTLKAAQVLLEDDRYSFKTPLPTIPKEGSK
jgi:flagellar assembly factor FliW